jgi:DNA-binding transcriptional MerR regulator
MVDEARYGIDELARLGGVTRRTVRYYVQEGVLPAPLGLGRGRHYAPEHLARLERVKALQEQGLSLEEVRQQLERRDPRGRAAELATLAEPEVARSAWTRVEIVPGIELHVSGQRRLPPPGRLRELAEWCERNFQPLSLEAAGQKSEERSRWRRH